MNIGEAIKKAVKAFIKMAAKFIEVGSDMLRGVAEMAGSMCVTLLTSMSKMLDNINKNMQQKPKKKVAKKRGFFSFNSSPKQQDHEQ